MIRLAAGEDMSKEFCVFFFFYRFLKRKNEKKRNSTSFSFFRTKKKKHLMIFARARVFTKQARSTRILFLC